MSKFAHFSENATAKALFAQADQRRDSLYASGKRVRVHLIVQELAVNRMTLMAARKDITALRGMISAVEY